jgi:carbon-monoxide dehydrogenase medium subunit
MAARIPGYPDAVLLAGGMSLLPMMNMRYVQVDHVIDLGRIEPLRELTVAKDRVLIGAMVPQRVLETDAGLARIAPLFPLAYTLVGHATTRNRGTFGGAICNLDPSSEQPAIALALDACLTLVSASGKRKVEAPDWALGYMMPNIQPGELLTEISFEPWAAGHGVGIQEFSRRHGDYALSVPLRFWNWMARGLFREPA